MCSRDLSCCVCGVLGHLTPVHRCARSVCCVVCGVSWVTWLLFTGVSAWCAALCVRCPGPLGSCPPVCPLGALRCVCGVQGHLAPVHRCARSVRCFACAVSLATWLLFTGVLAWFVVLRVRCPGPLDSCSPVRPLGVLCCVRGVLGHLAPVHRCVRLVCCFVCAVSWTTWLLFTGGPARCVALRLRCPGPLGSWSPVRPFGALLCLCGVLSHLAPVHGCARVVCRVACAVSCARSVCCVVCGVSWVTWLLLTGASAWCAALSVRCPGPFGSCSPVCLAVVSHPFVVLGACACAVSWPRWRLFTDLRAVCGVRVPLVVVSLFLPPQFFFPFFVPSRLFFFFGKNRQNYFYFCQIFTKKGPRVHCRHKHGQLVQWCNSVVFSGLCRRCFGGHAPGVRLVRPDVHGYGSGWVWLGAPLL